MQGGYNVVLANGFRYLFYLFFKFIWLKSGKGCLWTKRELNLLFYFYDEG